MDVMILFILLDSNAHACRLSSDAGVLDELKRTKNLID